MGGKKWIFCLLLCAFNAQVSFSSDPNLDSLLSLANAKMYTNPSETIAIGDSLLLHAQLTNEEKVKVLIVIMHGYASIRDNEKALEYGLLAENLLTEQVALKSKIDVFHYIGSQYHALKMFNQAISYFDKSEVLILDLPDSIDMAFSSGYNNLSRAFIYRDQMGCDIALPQFQKAIDNYSSIADRVSAQKNLSIAYYNKGNCEFQLQMTDSAERSYLAAIAIAELNDAKTLTAFAQKGLAILYTSQGDYERSLLILENAVINGKNAGDPLLDQSIYKAIADNYLAIGDLDKFQIYSLKTGEIQAGIIKKQRKSVAAALNELKESSDASISASKSKQVTWIALILSASLLVLLTMAILIRTGVRQRARLREKITALQGVQGVE